MMQHTSAIYFTPDCLLRFSSNPVEFGTVVIFVSCTAFCGFIPRRTGNSFPPLGRQRTGGKIAQRIREPRDYRSAFRE
jgi:hypothetical protein